MSKTTKNGLIIALIIIILLMIIWLGYDAFKKEPADANVLSPNLVDENTGLDNYINDLFSNVVGNEIQDNTVQNDTTNETATSNDNIQKESTETPSGSVTSREERAIELVKQEWGDEDGVYFVNESIDSQGRYIVSVRDSATTSSIAYYKVDVDKQLVTKR